jgi:SOS response associated peptidase (SRAP)
MTWTALGKYCGGPCYNIAPSQEARVIVAGNERPHLTSMRWGLVPFWTTESTKRACRIRSSQGNLRVARPRGHAHADWQALRRGWPLSKMGGKPMSLLCTNAGWSASPVNMQPKTYETSIPNDRTRPAPQA